MVARIKSKKQSNSVIDNSKNFQVITHSLYLVANPKTGRIKQECRIEKNQIGEKLFAYLIKI